MPSLGARAIPNWRPRAELHPSDAYTIKMKAQMGWGSFWKLEEAEPQDVEHFRRVYFSM